MRENVNDQKMIEVPVFAMKALCDMAREACNMHAGFIRMFRQETELKKRHKAYLDLRDTMEKTCDRDMEDLIRIKEFVQGAERIIEFQAAEEDADCEHCPDRESCCMADEYDMVIMSLEDLEILADDIIDLADTVDSLTEVFEALMSGKSIRGNDLQKILNDAQATAEEAMNHLENVETDSLTA